MPLGNAGREGLFTNLLLLLDPDPVEKRFQSSSFDKFRNEGLIVWTSIDFDTAKKEANVWMDDDMALRIMGKQWVMGLYRTDIWQPCFEAPELVDKEMKKGCRWMESNSCMMILDIYQSTRGVWRYMHIARISHSSRDSVEGTPDRDHPATS